MKVYISETAFINIILSAIEVYRKECLGVLLGHKVGSNKYVVEYAVPYQSADRKYAEVRLKTMREERLRKNLKFLTYISEIGDFHSHCNATTELSDTDIKDMDLNKNNIYMILSVCDQKKRIPWQSLKEGDISGSIGRDFSVRLTCYYIDRKKNKPTKAKIICPYALSFEYLQETARESLVTA